MTGSLPRKLKNNTRPGKLKFLSATTLALSVSVAALIQCTTGNDCRKERDREVTCGLLAVDFARSCDATARANGTSAASCTDPLLGAFLLCPLTVDEVCE